SGDVAGASDPGALDLGRAHGKRRGRALDFLAAQGAGQRHALAPPPPPGIGVDHLVALGRRARPQHAAVVGAKVDGGEGVRKTTAVPASLRRGVPGHCDLVSWADGNPGSGRGKWRWWPLAKVIRGQPGRLAAAVPFRYILRRALRGQPR